MPHHEPLDKLFGDFLQTAKQKLRKRGHLAHEVLLLAGPPKQPQLTRVPQIEVGTEQAKNRTAKRIAQLLELNKAWGYLMVYEVWLHQDNPPERHEAICIALFTHDYRRCSLAIFERHGKRIEFTEEVASDPGDEFAGRFAKLLPPMNRKED